MHENKTALDVKHWLSAQMYQEKEQGGRGYNWDILFLVYTNLNYEALLWFEQFSYWRKI